MMRGQADRGIGKPRNGWMCSTDVVILSKWRNSTRVFLCKMV